MTSQPAELGPFLRRTSEAIAAEISPDQVYVALWSHAQAAPSHIHWVVQPVTASDVAELDAYGPRLQAAMFDRGRAPSRAEIEDVAARLRRRLHGVDPPQ